MIEEKLDMLLPFSPKALMLMSLCYKQNLAFQLQGRRIKKSSLAKELTNSFHPILLLAFLDSYFL